MKLTIALLIAAFLQVHAEGYSQQITLSQKNAQLEDVFKQIMNQTDYHFLYYSQALKDAKPVDIELTDASLTEALEQCFKGQPLTYILDNNTVIVKALPTPPPPVKGKITNSKGESLPGVTVLVKGTSKATVTDANGNYSIEVAEDEKVLVFSYIGMKTQEVNINSQLVINVVLQQEVAQLGEVVVTGYQTIAKERTTGSFAKVSGEQLDQKRLVDLNTVLDGQVAGLNDGLLRGVTSMNGVTNPLYVIDGFPVENTRYDQYGSIIENLPNLNLQDIESITILKDAAATSIYGARAANGVVVVVTRKATKDKTEISFSSDITTSPYSYYTKNLTDAADIIGMEKSWATGNPQLQVAPDGSGFITDADANAYASSLRDNAVYNSQGMQALLDYYSGKMTQTDLNSKLNSLSSKGYQYYKDIEKYAKRNPVYQQYNLSFGKSTGKNSFNASFNYKKNKFQDINSKNESIGVNIRNSTEITKWLTFEIGTYTFYNNATTQTYSALNPGYLYEPYNQLADASGNPFVSTAASRYDIYTQDNITNYGLYSMDITPINELGLNQKKNQDFLNRSYTRLNFKLTDWLKYSASFQYEYGVSRVNQLEDKNSFAVRSEVNGLATVSDDNQAIYNLPYGNILFKEDQYSNAYNFRQQFDINKTIAEKHELTILLGQEVRHSKLEYANSTLYNYDPEILSFSPVNQNTLINTYGTLTPAVYLYPSDFAQQRELVDRFVSFYSNAGYTYNKKYTLTGSLRWDRSNLWGTDSKLQNKPFWSVGAGWNINKESFFNVAWVDMLKLRMSYGIGGNIAKNSAPYMTAYYSPNTTVGGIQGTINSRPNPQLSWEQTATTNLGVDFSILKGGLSGSVEIYNKIGSDLLANTQGVPTEGWGYSTYTINNGEMRNKGVELSLNGSIVKAKDFEWNASFVYGHNNNEVTYVNVKAPVYFLQLDYPESFPRVGNSYNTIYGYKWAGLSSTGLPQVYDKDGNPTSTQPTDLESIVSCGSSVPVNSGSFGSSLRYKDFELSCLFVFQTGYKLRNTNIPTLSNQYSSATYDYIPIVSVTNKRITERWQQPGDEAKTDVPRIVYEYDPDYNSNLSTIYSLADINVVDASHVRLSNVSLSYHLPEVTSQKLYLQNVRFYFNIENLATFAANKDAKFMLGGYNPPNYVLGMNLNF